MKIVAATPTLSDVLPLAAQDISRVPLLERQFTRYFRIDGDAKWKEMICRVLAGHVNSLSREPDITQPTLILQSGISVLLSKIPVELWNQVCLARVNLADYRWDSDIYKNLREQSPWTHVEITSTEKKSNTYTIAPWLAESPLQQSQLSILIRETRSSVPLLRADNFIWQTAIAAERKVGYYGLLEIKDQASFDKIVGFDRKASVDFTKEMLSVVSLSGVAKQPRRIGRFNKIGGAVWITFDNRKAVNKNNPLRVLNEDFKHDASEVYAHLANDMWAMGLFAANGSLQDSAPDFVGGDHHAHGNDYRIHVYFSCNRCHNVGGLQDISNWAAGLFKAPELLKGSFPLVSYDPEVVRELRRKYVRPLETSLIGDRARYAAALLEASGLTPEEYSSGLTKVFVSYDAPVDLERAARDVGVTSDYLVAALKYYAINTAVLDPVLRTWIDEPIKGNRLAMGIDQHHESIPFLHLALRGYIPVLKGEKK